MQAIAHPQFEVYQLAHADILITQVEKRPSRKGSIANDVQGSAKTLAALSHQQPPAKASSDPWDVQDPWQHYQGPLKQSKTWNQDLTSEHIDLIATKVHQKLQGAKPMMPGLDHDAAMGSDDRVTCLEERLDHLESSMEAHQARQLQVNNDLSAQISLVQHHAEQQTSAIHSHIDNKMQEQLTHIERLLSKRRAE